LTFDLMPHVGRIRDGAAAGTWYAYGYGGHGVAVATYLGHQVGEILAGVRATTPFAEIEHRRTFFTPYDRVYLPLVSAWFRFRDWVS
jgi:glycine/D-amino acid oxidase-like deaminating enzyme